MMKNIYKALLICLFMLAPLAAVAVTVPADGPSVDGATYSLPLTGVRLTLKVEKTEYTPGSLSAYARRFLRNDNVAQEAQTTYRIIDTNLAPTAKADPSKTFTAHVDQKHNITKVVMADGILLAVNTDAQPPKQPVLHVTANNPVRRNPYDYLSQDILAAGSKMKMAELCAKEIYDIRDSRNELSRGQADYMPKDGQQLRIMLAKLDEQESAIRQLFEGVTTVDTAEVVLEMFPKEEMKDKEWFRFSRYGGVVDTDDLSGVPYCISVENLHSVPSAISDDKKQKDNTGIWICRPGKIRVTLTANGSVAKQMEILAAQFGEIENLNEPLFMKKVNTSIVLNPYNGGIETIQSEPVK